MFTCSTARLLGDGNIHRGLARLLIGERRAELAVPTPSSPSSAQNPDGQPSQLMSHLLLDVDPSEGVGCWEMRKLVVFLF